MDNKKHKSHFSKQPNSRAYQSTETNRKFTELQSNKPRNSRRRENSHFSKNDQQRSNKQYSSIVRSYVDKRPRPRAIDVSCRGTPIADKHLVASGSGLAFEDYGHSRDDAENTCGHGTMEEDTSYSGYELNSVYSPGSKKQNLNHLLNFYYAPRDYSMGLHNFDHSATGLRRIGTGKVNKKHTYNKEQFMQANFQFVIKFNGQPISITSPDTPVDWNLIEQIIIQTTEEPQCPICLYPPIAAKMTRCGHAYCWPCILHYLALSDKTWRKCPICYEAIHTADLKSTIIVQQQPITVGDQIVFHLMQRKKTSIIVERFKSAGISTEQCYPQFASSDDVTKRFSKFLIANRSDILNIIEREYSELIKDEDSACPEFVFIQQALDLLKERRQKLENSTAEIIEGYEATFNKEASVTLQGNDANNVVAAKSDLCMMEPIGNNARSNKSTHLPSKYYYFYQSDDGQNIYLHPLNVKMLQACYGTLDQAPLLIKAHILQKDYHSMDEERRRRFACLAHLPLTCQFAIVEVDMQPPIITDDILKLFQEDILARKVERQRRDREERRRDRRIEEINDRQMGKLITNISNINFSSSQEFPACGFEDSLINNNEAAAKGASGISIPHVTYSSVAVVGVDSPYRESWPTLSSPANNDAKGNEAILAWRKSTAGSSIGTRQMLTSRNAEPDLVQKEAINADLDAPKTSLAKHTNFGDVFAEALLQKKHCHLEKSDKTNSGLAVSNKKNRKAKKMVPLFSTGMNYSDK